MKATIRKKEYDTDEAKSLGIKYTGEFGQPDGYEEQLFVTEEGLHFIYGAGGPESPYAEPTIKPLTELQTEKWKKNNIEE